MEKTGWKALAIVFIVLFLIETAIFGIGMYLVLDEEEKTGDCFYNFCAEYPDAEYDAGVCVCYSEDGLGYPIVADTKYYN